MRRLACVVTYCSIHSPGVMPAGEYRFRFISYVDAEVDSVAGFHIDNDAPDLLVTVDSLHVRYQGAEIDSLHTQYVDYGENP